jgi:hypothetical protein
MEWDKEAIVNKLRNTICRFVFTKVNGDTRVMYGTLSEKFLPKQTDLEEVIQNKEKNSNVLSVWDVEASGWRSFRWDSLKEYSAAEK